MTLSSPVPSKQGQMVPWIRSGITPRPGDVIGRVGSSIHSGTFGLSVIDHP